MTDNGVPGANHDECGRGEDSAGSRHIGPGWKAPEQSEEDSPSDAHDAHDAGDAKARNHKHLEDEGDEPDAEENQLFPARQPDQQMTSKESAERGKPHDSGDAEGGCLELNDDSQRAQRQQNRSHDGMREKADEGLRPVDGRRVDFRIRESQLVQQCLERLDFRGGHIQLHRFAPRQGKQLTSFHHSLDGDLFVHHGLGDARIEATSFCERPELAAHDADDFFGRFLAAAHNGRRSADGRGAAHEDRIRRQGNHGSRADRPLVHERVDRHLTSRNRFDDPLRGVHPTTRRLELEDPPRPPQRELRPGIER